MLKGKDIRVNGTFVSLVIITLSFILLGVLYPNWYFFSDDFGLVWGAKIESLSNLSKHFYAKGLHFHFQPHNYNIPEQTFFSQLYRPLLYIFYSLQYLFFGFSAYGFLLVSALLHGVNGALLFYILKRYLKTNAALFTVAYFSFHASLVHWFGWVTAQQHILNVALTLLTVLFFIQYREKKNGYFYLLSCASLLTSLLVRETNIIFPFWATFTLFFEASYGKNFMQNLKSIPSYLRITSGFWLTTIIVFLFRALLFPIKKTSGDLTTILSLSAFIKDTSGKFFHLVTFLTDLFNLSFLPGNIRVIKGSILGAMILAALWLLITSKRKHLLLYLGTSSIMFMWPAIVRFYTSRFLYISLPFVIVGFIVLFEPVGLYIKRKQQTWLKAIPYLPILVLIVNITTLPISLKSREHSLKQNHETLKSLVSFLEKDNSHNHLCFVGIPENLFITGLAQAMYINGYPQNYNIYYDRGTFFSWERKLTGETKLKKTGDTFTLSASDNSLHFKGGCGTTCMGKYNIISKNNKGEPSKMQWTPDPSRYEDPTRFITWDCSTNQFQAL